MKKLLFLATTALFASCTNVITVKTDDGKIIRLADNSHYSDYCDNVILTKTTGGNWHIYSCNEGIIPQPSIHNHITAKKDTVVYLIDYKSAKILR